MNNILQQELCFIPFFYNIKDTEMNGDKQFNQLEKRSMLQQNQPQDNHSKKIIKQQKIGELQFQFPTSYELCSLQKILSFEKLQKKLISWQKIFKHDNKYFQYNIKNEKYLISANCDNPNCSAKLIYTRKQEDDVFILSQKITYHKHSSTIKCFIPQQIVNKQQGNKTIGLSPNKNRNSQFMKNKDRIQHNTIKIQSVMQQKTIKNVQQPNNSIKGLIKDTKQPIMNVWQKIIRNAKQERKQMPFFEQKIEINDNTNISTKKDNYKQKRVENNLLISCQQQKDIESKDHKNGNKQINQKHRQIITIEISDSGQDQFQQNNQWLNNNSQKQKIKQPQKIIQNPKDSQINRIQYIHKQNDSNIIQKYINNPVLNTNKQILNQKPNFYQKPGFNLFYIDESEYFKEKSKSYQKPLKQKQRPFQKQICLKRQVFQFPTKQRKYNFLNVQSTKSVRLLIQNQIKNEFPYKNVTLTYRYKNWKSKKTQKSQIRASCNNQFCGSRIIYKKQKNQRQYKLICYQNHHNHAPKQTCSRYEQQIESQNAQKEQRKNDKIFNKNASIVQKVSKNGKSHLFMKEKQIIQETNTNNNGNVFQFQFPSKQLFPQFQQINSDQNLRIKFKQAKNNSLISQNISYGITLWQNKMSNQMKIGAYCAFKNCKAKLIYLRSIKNKKFILCNFVREHIHSNAQEKINKSINQKQDQRSKQHKIIQKCFNSQNLRLNNVFNTQKANYSQKFDKTPIKQRSQQDCTIQQQQVQNKSQRVKQFLMQSQQRIFLFPSQAQISQLQNLQILQQIYQKISQIVWRYNINEKKVQYTIHKHLIPLANKPEYKQPYYIHYKCSYKQCPAKISFKKNKNVLSQKYKLYQINSYHDHSYLSGKRHEQCWKSVKKRSQFNDKSLQNRNKSKDERKWTKILTNGVMEKQISIELNSEKNKENGQMMQYQSNEYQNMEIQKYCQDGFNNESIIANGQIVHNKENQKNPQKDGNSYSINLKANIFKYNSHPSNTQNNQKAVINNTNNKPDHSIKNIQQQPILNNHIPQINYNSHNQHIMIDQNAQNQSRRQTNSSKSELLMNSLNGLKNKIPQKWNQIHDYHQKSLKLKPLNNKSFELKGVIEKFSQMIDQKAQISQNQMNSLRNNQKQKLNRHAQETSSKILQNFVNQWVQNFKQELNKQIKSNQSIQPAYRLLNLNKIKKDLRINYQLLYEQQKRSIIQNQQKYFSSIIKQILKHKDFQEVKLWKKQDLNQLHQNHKQFQDYSFFNCLYKIKHDKHQNKSKNKVLFIVRRQFSICDDINSRNNGSNSANNLPQLRQINCFIAYKINHNFEPQLQWFSIVQTPLNQPQNIKQKQCQTLTQTMLEIQKNFSFNQYDILLQNDHLLVKSIQALKKVLAEVNKQYTLNYAIHPMIVDQVIEKSIQSTELRYQLKQSIRRTSDTFDANKKLKNFLSANKSTQLYGKLYKYYEEFALQKMQPNQSIGLHYLQQNLFYLKNNIHNPFLQISQNFIIAQKTLKSHELLLLIIYFSSYFQSYSSTFNGNKIKCEYISHNNNKLKQLEKRIQINNYLNQTDNFYKEFSDKQVEIKRIQCVFNQQKYQFNHVLTNCPRIVVQLMFSQIYKASYLKGQVAAFQQIKHTKSMKIRYNQLNQDVVQVKMNKQHLQNDLNKKIWFCQCNSYNKYGVPCEHQIYCALNYKTSFYRQISINWKKQYYTFEKQKQTQYKYRCVN